MPLFDILILLAIVPLFIISIAVFVGNFTKNKLLWLNNVQYKYGLATGIIGVTLIAFNMIGNLILNKMAMGYAICTSLIGQYLALAFSIALIVFSIIGKDNNRQEYSNKKEIYASSGLFAALVGFLVLALTPMIFEAFGFYNFKDFRFLILISQISTTTVDALLSTLALLFKVVSLLLGIALSICVIFSMKKSTNDKQSPKLYANIKRLSTSLLIFTFLSYIVLMCLVSVIYGGFYDVDYNESVITANYSYVFRTIFIQIGFAILTFLLSRILPYKNKKKKEIAQEEIDK